MGSRCHTKRMIGEPLEDLFAAICKQALRDAQQHDAEAIAFLWDVLPEEAHTILRRVLHDTRRRA